MRQNAWSRQRSEGGDKFKYTSLPAATLRSGVSSGPMGQSDEQFLIISETRIARLHVADEPTNVSLDMQETDP